MNSSLLFRRLKKWRSDRLLAWVFPHAINYTVVTWRRINPRYDMSYGDFKGINDWAIADVSFRRTHLGALLVQFIMGRPVYSDGFRQQVVIITEPRADYLKPPDTSAYDFDGYPTVAGYGSGVDLCNDVSNDDDAK